jgi:hypothetical protein
MPTALEKAKQRRAELDAKIKRDELRIEARALIKQLARQLTAREDEHASITANALANLTLEIAAVRAVSE